MARGKSRRAAGLDGRIDELYRLPLAEFTTARNALAAELKKDGDREASERVRGLGKPVVTAWIVNRLYRDDREGFDRLLEIGARLRTLQIRGAADAGTLRDVVESRRGAIRALLEQAEALAGECGVAASPGTLRRLETNLGAIAAYGGAGPDQQLGRVTADLEPPGFEALLQSGATAPRRSSRTATTTATRSDLRKLERARAAHDRARKEVERRQLESKRAESTLQKTKERLEETREMVRAAKRGLLLLQNKDRRAERELADAGSRLDVEQESLSRAREALREAQAKLKNASRRSL